MTEAEIKASLKAAGISFATINADWIGVPWNQVRKSPAKYTALRDLADKLGDRRFYDTGYRGATIRVSH